MAKKRGKAEKKERQALMPDIIAAVRAAVSLLILILAYTCNVSKVVSILLIAAASLICGLDILVSAVVTAIKKRDYFTTQSFMFVCAIACLCIGCYIETVVMLAVYQLCGCALSIAVRKTKSELAGALSEEDAEGRLKLRSILSGRAASESSVRNKYYPYFDLFSKAAFIVGVLFAVLVPMLTDMTYVMSIRRACMLIIAAAPASALAALPLYSLAGISRSAEYGVFIKDSETLEKIEHLSAVIYDKTDVFTEGTPKLVSLNSPMLDKDNFLMLAAYTAYNSQQRFAAPVVSAYNGDIVTSYISDFNEIPGCGMEIVLNGRNVLLGTMELFNARGITIPDTERRDGYVLYLAVSGVCAGCIVLKENVNPYAGSVISDLRGLGEVKSILITEEGRDVSERLAKSLSTDELHYECDFNTKAEIIQKQKNQLPPNEALMYISAENLEYHTAADIDAKVGNTFDNADVLTSNVGIYGLPIAYTAAKCAKRLSHENSIFTAFVKLVLIVLALTGNATLWFIVLADYAASIAGVLSAVRFKIVKSENQI